MNRMLGAVAGVIASLALGSCSYSIDIVAKVIDGKVAFVSSDSSFDCIANIMVTAEDGHAPEPEAGDDIGLVKNGAAYWWTSSPVTECTTKFPVIYGHLVDRTKPAVAPKKLRVGVIYEVTTQGGGAYGGGRFRIGADRRIENLPWPPPQTDTENTSSSKAAT